MIAALAIGVPIAVAIAFVWIRSSADRTNRRSMQRYGSGLGRLGDIASKSDAAASVHLPPPTEIARPHIGLEPSATALDSHVEHEPVRARLVLPSAQPGEPFQVPVFDDVHPLDGTSGTASPSETTAALARMVERSRSTRGVVGNGSAVRPPGDTESMRLRRITAPTLRFGLGASDGQDDPVTTAAIPVTTLRARLPVPPSPADLARRVRIRRLSTVGAALVLIAGLSLFFGTRHVPAPPAAIATTTTIRAVTTTTLLPSVLSPVSVTAQLVVYRVPTKSYTVHFSVTGTSWLGAQPSVGSTYLWMDTLTAGGTTTYSATGPRIIRLGAPRFVTIAVNGIPVQLPTNVQPYNLEFLTP